MLDRPIKTLGMHPVRVMLHPEVGVTITANVAQSQEAAKLQEAGIDPLALREDQEQPEGAAQATAPEAPTA